MNSKLDTIVRSPAGVDRIKHPFFPALAVEIGLKEGLPLRTPIVNTVAHQLRENLKDGYMGWSEHYPADYDSTVVARNVLDMLGDKQQTDLELSFAENGLVHTYKGGTKTKSNSSDDLLINVRVLDYLLNNKTQKQDAERIQEVLRSQPEKFRGDVRNVSKYYLSNGFLVYALAPVAEELDVDIEEIVNQKGKITNKTDVGCLVLASMVDFGDKYGNADTRSLSLFQHPRLQKLFSCSYFDEVVRACADQKLREDQTFDEITAEIYDKVGNTLYDYKKSARELSALLDEQNITSQDSFVELAVGTGNLLIHMVEQGRRVYGVDVSQQMLKRARRKLEKYESNVILEHKHVMSLSLQNPARVMYTHNFIDIYEDRSVQFWAATETEAEEMLEAINKNLEKEGYFFVPKKQVKGTSSSFSLSVETFQEGKKLENTYLYQDADFTLRRSYKKVVYSFEEFSAFVSNFGWSRKKENDSWVLYKKL